MQINASRRNDFMKLMTKVAQKHDLDISFNMDSRDINRMVVDIESCAILRHSYKINWEEEPSLTEAAVTIWADFFSSLSRDPVVQYNRMDVEATTNIYRNMVMSHHGANPNSISTIKNVIFNDPATIVFWSDGTKTVVKCQEGDTFDPEKGLAMAVSKKALGNQGNYNEVFKKWYGQYDVEPIYPNIPICNELNTSTTFKEFLNTMKKFNEAIGNLGKE